MQRHVPPDPPTPDQSFPTDPAGLPEATRPDLLELGDGDTLNLRVGPVAKRLGDTTVRMLGYNGSIPGPTLKVRQGSEVVVNVTNQGDLDTTVHWHGLRLENQYDGVPHETQARRSRCPGQVPQGHWVGLASCGVADGTDLVGSGGSVVVEPPRLGDQFGEPVDDRGSNWLPAQLGHGLRVAALGRVGSWGGHRGEGVAGGDDAGAQRDLLAGQPVGRPHPAR
jgi:hypothetical protein